MKYSEPVELTNMCMIVDPDGNLLVENRLDPRWHGLTFPGGHVEKGESVVRSVIREIREEAGLDIRNPKLVGIKQFINDQGIRYIVFLYRCTEFSGTPRGSSEGPVFWISREELDRSEKVPDLNAILKIYDGLGTELYYPHDNLDDDCQVL